MVTIAVCDDSPQDLEKLTMMMGDYLQERNIVAQVETFSHPDQLLQTSQGFDIYFLDMLMPMYSGIEVGLLLRERNDRGQILYVTSSRDYGVDAFSVHATHYIMKPYTAQEFARAMERAMGAVQVDRGKEICLKTEGGQLYHLHLDELSYVESHGHVMHVHTREKTIVIRRTLANLMQELAQLAPRQFVSPHKGYLVNQKAILSMGKDGIALKGGDLVPVAKRQYGALQEGYLDFLFATQKEVGV